MKKSLQMGGVILASLFTSTSCQNEAIVSENQQSNYTLNVSSFVGSRTYVEQSGEVKWSEGDKLYVYGPNVTGVLTLSEGADTNEGKFSGFVFGNPDNLQWAVFGDDVKFTADGAQFTIKEITDPNSNSPMVGAIGSGSVQMEHLCGMVRLTINNLPQNATVTLGGTGIAGTAEVKNGAIIGSTLSNSIALKTVKGSDNVFEVPVFAKSNKTVIPLVLSVGGVSVSFDAPVQIGSLSSEAIMEFNCSMNSEGEITSIGKAAVTGESVALELQKEGDVFIELGNNVTIGESVVVKGGTFAIINTNGNSFGFNEKGVIDNNGTLVFNGNLSDFISGANSTKPLYPTNITGNGDVRCGYYWNGVSYSYNAADQDKTIYIKAVDGTTTYRGIIEEKGIGIKSVVVEEGITSIGNRTFRRYYDLESVVLPNTLTEIVSAAFQSCRNLSEIIIPSSVTTIGEYAFGECYNLKTINIPSGVTRIEANTFNASGIESIELPASVTYLGNQVFRDCEALKEVVINAEEFEVEGNTFGNMAAPYPSTVIKVKNQAMKDYLDEILAKANGNTSSHKSFVTELIE